MDLLQRLGFPMPVDHLLHLVMGRMRGLERLSLLLPSDDVMLAPSLWQWLVDLRDHFSCFSHFYKRDVVGIVPVVDALFLCNLCGRSFSTQAALRLHDSKVHTKVRKKPVPSLKNLGDRIREHGVDGMPTCKYCLHPFPRWNGLTRHLRLGQCEAYPSRVAAGLDAPALQASAPPLIEHPTFFDDFARRGTQALSQYPAVLAEAGSHCCLCRQWFSSPSAYKTHLRRVHVEAWQQSGERSIQWVTAHSLSGPCPYCKANVSTKTKHKCPVLGHIYFAALHTLLLFIMGEEDAHMAPTATELQMFSRLLPEGGKTKPPKGSRKGPDKGKGPIPREESSTGSHSRASLLLQNSQAMQSAVQGGLLEREGDQTSWNYLAWDAQAKREIKDTAIAAMTHDRLLRRIKTFAGGRQGGTSFCGFMECAL